jgi:hypothetical protein
MAQIMPFRIGADASGTDGACGQVSRIIVNPVAREVTHLAVDPRYRQGPGRLVPVDLVDATTGQIRLRCTLAEFRTLQPAQETESVPDLDPTGHQHSSSNQVKSVLSAIGPWPARRDPGAPRPRRTRSPAAGHRRLRPIRHGRHTPRVDRLRNRRRDRTGPGAGRRAWRSPGHPRAPAEGAPAGPQGSGHPDQRRD